MLKPGKTCTDAIKLLESISQHDMSNIRNSIPIIGSPGFAQLMQSAVTKYEAWAGETIRRLSEVFIASDLPARIRGEKYWLIVAGDMSSSRTASMMRTEFSDLTLEFMYAANALREQRVRFEGRAGRCLVLDTNDLLHYQRFDKIPWNVIYGKGAWVVIPHVVLDEIDRKCYESGGKVHARARGVYRIFESLLSSLDSDGYAHLADGTECLVLADEPGHRRESNNGDEIVSRAAFIQQALTPGQLTLVTRDIGMRARAIAWSLKAENIPEKYLISADGLSSAQLTVCLEALEVDPQSDATP